MRVYTPMLLNIQVCRKMQCLFCWLNRLNLGYSRTEKSFEARIVFVWSRTQILNRELFTCMTHQTNVIGTPNVPKYFRNYSKGKLRPSARTPPTIRSLMSAQNVHIT